MLHHPPKFNYCGLTVMLGKPSRFDTKELLSGHAGQVFKSYLHPLNLDTVDIRTSDNVSLLPNTKVVLLLGDESLTRHYPSGGKINLNDARGNPEVNPYNNVVYLPSYAPQEAFDFKAEYEAGEDADEESGEGEEDIKGHGTTKRRNWRWWLLNDAKKAIRILNNGQLCTSSSDLYNTRLYPDINEAIEELLSKRDEQLFLDTETAKRQILTCVGFNFSSSKDVFVVPWKRYNNTLMYDDRLCRRFIQALAVAMGRNEVVCHNASYDLLVLCWKYKIPLPRRVFDTMLAWHRCYPEVEKSLGHLISYFLYRPFHKNDGVYEPHNPQQEEQLYNYNAKDIITMREIYPALKEELVKCKAVESAAWANRMVRPYLTATLRGIKTDTKEFCQRYDMLELKRVQVNRCIGIITGRPDMNVRSWQQKKQYLYEDLKLPCPDDDAPTSSKTLLRLLTKKTVPSVKLMLLSTRTSKLASSMKFRLWPDLLTGEYNRFTGGYNIAGTDSFRLGSRAIFKYKRGDTDAKLGYGTNLQNQKKEQRTLIKPDFGLKLGQVDQAGAEALIVAYLCRHARFRELFLNGIKSHVFVALHVFRDVWTKRIGSEEVLAQLCNCNPRELKSHPRFKEVEKLIKESDNWPAKERYYFIAKMICHASNYGMKFPTFQINVLEKSDGAVELSIPQCKNFLELYHRLFPEIEQWHAEIRDELIKTRVLFNLFGEPRRFNDHFGDNLWKSAYAFKPQSTVGQITNYAFTEIQELCDIGGSEEFPIREWYFSLLQNNHDSILFQFKPEFEKQVCKMVTGYIERALVSPRGEQFKMKSECQVGYNWCPEKKIINPDGLKEINIYV